jgi:hypothetical protein
MSRTAGHHSVVPAHTEGDQEKGLSARGRYCQRRRALRILYNRGRKKPGFLLRFLPTYSLMTKSSSGETRGAVKAPRELECMEQRSLFFHNELTGLVQDFVLSDHDFGRVSGRNCGR